MSRPSIVVVGGGIAGLAAAWELSGGEVADPEAPRIEVLEGSPRLGGALAAREFAGRTMDLGPDGFLARRPEATVLVRELGAGDDLEPIAASGASIFLEGRAWPLPEGLALGVPTSPAQLRAVGGLGRRARLGAWRDRVLPRRVRVGEDATIGEIVAGKLGRELAYRFVEPMVGGIQAGRIDELSAAAVFPALLGAAREGGSLMGAMARLTRPGPTSAPASPGPLFYSLAGGIGSLAERLSAALEQRGVILRTGAAVTAVRETPAGAYPLEVDTAATTTPADVVILATPASEVARLLGEREAALAALDSVPYASTAMVTFVVRDAPLPPTGTGILVPLGTPWPGAGPMMVTALTFLDRKWPRLARPGESLVRCHVGRSDDRRQSELDDEALGARVADELAHLLGAPLQLEDRVVQRWPEALPQYRVGHQAMVAAAREAAARHRVALAGGLYDGVGIPASIGSGRRAAREAVGWLD